MLTLDLLLLLKSISIIHVSDVLPPLASLSRVFQKRSVDFTVVKPWVSETKAAVDALLLTPGGILQ